MLALAHVVVGIDGSSAAEACLPMAQLFCLGFGARMTLQLIPDGDEEDTALEATRDYLERLAALIRRSGVEVTTQVSGSGASRTLLALSEEADLMVVATRGQGSVARRDSAEIGSVADSLCSSSVAPVLLVPPGA
jgi:nucleotide-binding universal stress UspA family protein